MYEQYLKRRMDSPSNGIITDEATFKNLADITRTTVVYEIYDPVREVVVTFGKGDKLALTDIGRASGIANAVSYGWELLDLGADTVVVKILGFSFLCDSLAVIDRQRVTQVLEYLSGRVSATPKTGWKKITLWAHLSEFDTMSVWYDPPLKSSHRGPYLANLSGYLTRIFDTPIQLDYRSSGADMIVDHPDYGNRERQFASVNALQHLLMPDEVIRSVANALRIYNFKTLVEMRTSTVEEVGDPSVVFEIQLAGWTYQLPAWCRGAPEHAVRAIQSVLEEAFKTLASTVEVRVTTP